MSTAEEYIFILWGNGFDEAMVAVFVTELRRVGLKVKIVGLTQRHSSGTFGLTLIPDLTLEEALSLADKAICLVIPYASSGSNRLGNDPRLGEFFQQAQANQAKFVVEQLDETDLGLFPLNIDKIMIDPQSEDLIKIARRMAHSLSQAI